MTINQLKAFMCVCRHLNYTTAANELFISRQGLRQNIAALENELNVTLFSVTANRLSVTLAGEKLLEECREVVESFDSMEKRLFSELNFGRHLKLCISTACVPDFLPELQKILSDYASKEHILIDCVSALNDDCAAYVISGECDGAVVMDLREEREDLERTELSAHTSSLFVANTHRFWNRESVDLSELDGEKICVPGKGTEFAALFNRLESYGCRYEAAYFPNYYQVYYNVRDNGYVAVNRYLPRENESPDYTRDIIIRDLPELCGSFLRRSDTDGELVALERYLKEYYKKYFA